jgi:ProQ/FINO family
LTTITSHPARPPRLTLGARPPETGADNPPASAPAPAARDRAAAPPEPRFVAEFRRLSTLVPKGAWPATLPTDGKAALAPRPLALGLGDRLEALLPAAERKALRDALGAYCRSRAYLAALGHDEAVRWADDGRRPIGTVSEEHRLSATTALLSRAVADLRAVRRKPKP